MNSIMTEIDKIINNQAMDTQVLEQLLIQYKAKNQSSKNSEKIFKLLDGIVVKISLREKRKKSVVLQQLTKLMKNKD